MGTENFELRNDLERSLSDAQSGRIPVRVFLKELMNADLFVPSMSEVAADGDGFLPLVFHRENDSFIAVFTEITRIGECGGPADYCLAMRGNKLFAWIGKEYGIVINPGYSVGMEIPAAGVKEIWRDFGA